ncbi:hypothetical protein [Ravibacter arvi]
MDKHYRRASPYRVPYRFIGKKVKLLFSGALVEIYYRYEHIALHKRVKSPYNYPTDKEYLASTHRFLTEWTPDKFIEWASSIHNDVRLYILKILDRNQHPEQAYHFCIGILSFAKKAGEQRLICACHRALSYGIYSYKIIHRAAERMILGKNMDQYEDSLFADELPMPSHDNIRGEEYYQ